MKLLIGILYFLAGCSINQDEVRKQLYPSKGESQPPLTRIVEANSSKDHDLTVPIATSGNSTDTVPVVLEPDETESIPEPTPEPLPPFDLDACIPEFHDYPSAPGEWLDTHNQMIESSKNSYPNLIFIGDSITKGWSNSQSWRDKYLHNSLNFGIGGDNSMHVLWRLRHGALDQLGAMPKAFVLLIGFNDFAAVQNVTEVTRRIQCVVEELKLRAPNSKIVQLTVLPSGEGPDYITRIFFDKVNDLLKVQPRGVTLVEVNKEMLDPDNRSMLPGVTSDFVHPTNLGYDIILSKLAPVLNSL